MSTTWNSRTVRSERVAPEILIAHPDNIVIHTEEQEAQMQTILRTIGWAAPALVSNRSGRIIDGHLRVAIALKLGLKTVPVDYVDLTEEEEIKALLYLKRTTSLARIDPVNLEEVLSAIKTDDDAITAMMNSFAESAGVLKRQSQQQPKAVVETVKVYIGDLMFTVLWASYVFWRGQMQEKWGTTYYEIKADIRARLGLDIKAG